MKNAQKAINESLDLSISTQSRTNPALYTSIHKLPHKKKCNAETIRVFVESQNKFLKQKIINLALLQRTQDEYQNSTLTHRPAICKHSKEIMRDSSHEPFNARLGKVAKLNQTARIAKTANTKDSPGLCNQEPERPAAVAMPSDTPHVLISRIQRAIQSNKMRNSVEVPYEEFVNVLRDISVSAHDDDEIFLQQSLWDLVRKQEDKEMAEILYSIMHGEETPAIGLTLAKELHQTYSQLFLAKHSLNTRSCSLKTTHAHSIRTYINTFSPTAQVTSIKAICRNLNTRNGTSLTKGKTIKQVAVTQENICFSRSTPHRGKLNLGLGNSLGRQPTYRTVLTPKKPNVLGFESAVNRLLKAHPKYQ